MKNLLLVISVLFTQAVFGQNISEDQRLNARLNTYMKFNRELNFDSVMNYLHPEIFNISSRESLVQAFQSAFNSEDMHISVDSMRLVSITPVYKTGETEYRKVDYAMGMTLFFHDTSILASSDLIIQSLETNLPGKKVSLNEKNKGFSITGQDILLAIRRDKGEWMFLGVEKKNPALMKQLLPQEVIDHFRIL